MKYLQTYESFNYEDELLLEKLDIKNLIHNFKLSKNKKYINTIALSLLSILTLTKSINFVDAQNFSKEEKQLIKDELQKVSKDNETKVLKSSDFSKYKKGYDFVLSQKGWDFIRNEEKLRLDAYNLKDGRITIGWGHAEPIATSKYKVGQKISVSDAQKLLKDDLTEAADGVRRIFKEWEDKGINIEINQNQFDAMVSIAFNMGVQGLRTSKFIQYVKKGDFNSAANIIKREGLNKSFAGLEKRRIRESELFMA